MGFEITRSKHQTFGSFARSAFMTATLVGFAVALPNTADAARVPIHNTVDLNVRECPSTQCRILDVVPAGTCGIAHNWAAGGDWVEISYKGGRAYVSARYVRRGCL